MESSTSSDGFSEINKLFAIELSCTTDPNILKSLLDRLQLKLTHVISSRAQSLGSPNESLDSSILDSVCSITTTAIDRDDYSLANTGLVVLSVSCKEGLDKVAIWCNRAVKLVESMSHKATINGLACIICAANVCALMIHLLSDRKKLYLVTLFEPHCQCMMLVHVNRSGFSTNTHEKGSRGR
eukprot:GHVQ01015228.1.p1 GENE.GHVQ01015228.1~~GHVQ01015228.1.p1  ORF type:complete len:183 (-),score=13.75 GHVQ01015228.1:2354-2902(-)